MDVIVIGGGLVGLATAYQLLKKRPDLRVLVFEKEDGPARHQSGRNSGVIHSGVNYKPGSLKAQYCRRGYDFLIELCRREAIAFEICGKVVVANTEAEIAALAELKQRGEGNGLTGLKRLGPDELREREPNARGLQALWVPQTGIVEYKQVADALVRLIKAAGGEFRFREKVARLEELPDVTRVVSQRGEYDAKVVINCAGLYSDRLAEWMNFNLKVRIVPFRGEYYELRPTARGLIKNIIYPVPDPALPFLGPHFTRRISGRVEAGPNAVLALSREGYGWRQFRLRDTIETFSWPGFFPVAQDHWQAGVAEILRSLSKRKFTESLQKLVPAVTEADLIRAGSGVRAQAVSKDGRLIDDFLILENRRALHVLNAPSPAATAALSIGFHLADQAAAKLNQ